ncbi:MAG: flagellar hook basal-body protein [bacterium]|nr:flagellar hook basal-body protein [bacterium]
MESLELLANNIANQATAGYKTDREFYTLYTSPEAAENEILGFSPSTLPVIERQWTDFSQGTLRATGNPLDVAISGDGFLLARGPGGIYYTRNGNLHITEDGGLLTQQGYSVLDASQSPIQLDPSRDVEISADGSILQEGELVGRFGVMQVERPETLRKHDGCYFQATEGTAKPTEASGAKIYQGKLESANFAPSEAAVRLVGVMRQFEMLQKAISIGSEMNSQAARELARVTG